MPPLTAPATSVPTIGMLVRTGRQMFRRRIIGTAPVAAPDANVYRIGYANARPLGQMYAAYAIARDRFFNLDRTPYVLRAKTIGRTRRAQAESP